MHQSEKRNPGLQSGASENAQTIGHGLSFNTARGLDRLQYRLSGFALALDSTLPEVAFLENAVQLTALGLPLPAGGQVRLHRLALKLFDLRVILEEPLPEVRR